MKIITLLGEGSSGKSMSLKYLIEYVGKTLEIFDSSRNFLVERPRNNCSTYIDNAEWDDFLNNLRNEESVNYTKNIKDVFTKIIWNGKTVGIFTIGDSRNDLQRKLNLLQECDIIVCPTHNNPDMIGYLLDKATEGLLIIHKTKLSKKMFKKDFVVESQNVGKKLFAELAHEIYR